MAIDRITTGAVLDGAIATADIANDAVTTAKVADDAVTGAKIENNPTIAGNLATGGTLAIAGHGSIGNAGTVHGTRALTVVGATDGTSSQLLVGYNSSLSSKFSIRDDGYTTVGAGMNVQGNITLPSSAGIDFSGKPNAAGMSSELFDDYEEGTWTPVWTIAPSGTTTSLAGQYTKIGRLVYLQFQASGSNFSIGSYARVQGLPFAATDDSDSGTYIIGSIVQRGHGWISIVGGTNQLYFSSTGTTSSPTHISASAVYRI